MEIRNCTNRELVICGKKYPVYKRAFCHVSSETEGDIGGIPVIVKSYVTVENLPDPEPGVVYVVASLIAHVLAGTRDDLYTVGHVVRDAAGHVVSAGALVREDYPIFDEVTYGE